MEIIRRGRAKTYQESRKLIGAKLIRVRNVSRRAKERTVSQAVEFASGLRGSLGGRAFGRRWRRDAAALGAPGTRRAYHNGDTRTCASGRTAHAPR